MIPGKTRVFLNSAAAAAVVFLSFAVNVHGAGPQIKNVRFEQDKTGLVHIYYRLVNPERDMFDVSLKLSENGETGFDSWLKSTSGDIGEVSGEGNKHIIWKVEKDLPKINGSRFIFTVEGVSVSVRNRKEARLAAEKEKARLSREKEKERLAAEKEKARRKEEEKTRLASEREEARRREEEKALMMVLIPKGAYQMGSPAGEGDFDEQPRHKVYLDAFYLDKYEVTAAQYRKFTQAVGASMPEQTSPAADNNPVTQVSWDNAHQYCKWAGKRLPTEAEWEKAARGGTDTKWSFGGDESMLGGYAWYKDNSGNTTHRVGQKTPNPYGLYDMHGNVWEWCWDWYDKNYYGSSPERNPAGPATGTARVMRGGSWLLNGNNTRSGFRLRLNPANKNNNIGFRCAI